MSILLAIQYSNKPLFTKTGGKPIPDLLIELLEGEVTDVTLLYGLYSVNHLRGTGVRGRGRGH